MGYLLSTLVAVYFWQIAIVILITTIPTFMVGIDKSDWVVKTKKQFFSYLIPFWWVKIGIVKCKECWGKLK